MASTQSNVMNNLQFCLYSRKFLLTAVFIQRWSIASREGMSPTTVTLGARELHSDVGVDDQRWEEYDNYYIFDFIADNSKFIHSTHLFDVKNLDAITRKNTNNSINVRTQKRNQILDYKIVHKKYIKKSLNSFYTMSSL